MRRAEYRTCASLPGSLAMAHASAALAAVEVGECDWSDGEPTYHLCLSIAGETYALASCRSRDAVKSIRRRIDAFLARNRAGAEESDAA
jgi:hypothetical protein